MMRVATFFAASAAVVSAVKVVEDAEVDFEELFEGRFLSTHNLTNTTTTTTTTTTAASTTTTTTTAAEDHDGMVMAMDQVITVKLSANVEITHPVNGFTDDTFIAQLNMAAADRTDAVSHAFARGCWGGYYAMTFPDGAGGSTATTEMKAASTASFAFTASSRRRLATIGTGKSLDMEFATSGLTATQATTATAVVGQVSAAAAQDGLTTAIAASFLQPSIGGAVVAQPNMTLAVTTAPTAAVTDAPATTTETTTAASSAAGLGLPIVAALVSAVFMF